jgi:hypothetical protein
MPTSTPTEPPKATTVKKVFSLIRHRLCLDLYLSRPIKMKARILNKVIIQRMSLEEYIFLPLFYNNVLLTDSLDPELELIIEAYNHKKVSP